MIGICVDTSRLRGRPPEAPLHYQVQVYLAAFTEYSNVRKLCGCDPYADTRFSLHDALAMRRELDVLSVRVVSREVSAPPEAVGYSPGDPLDESYGVSGFQQFCNDFRSVCERAEEVQAGIFACGD